MMTIEQQQIIIAVQNTFKIDDVKRFITSERAQTIKGLPALLSLLNDEKSLPKAVAESLETVMLGIKTKNKNTALEKEFKKQIEHLVYEPMDNEDNKKSSIFNLWGR